MKTYYIKVNIVLTSFCVLNMLMSAGNTFEICKNKEFVSFFTILELCDDKQFARRTMNSEHDK